MEDNYANEKCVCEKVPTLEELKEKFLLVKQSQHTGELAMRDYRNCLADFLKHSQSSAAYELLKQDALLFLAILPLIPRLVLVFKPVRIIFIEILRAIIFVA